MADPAPEFQPDIPGALRLVVTAVMHLGQAVEANAAMHPTGGVGGAAILRAQQALQNATELLSDPNRPEPEAESPDPQPADGTDEPAGGETAAPVSEEPPGAPGQALPSDQPPAGEGV